MKTLPLVGLALALTGCFAYGRPVMRPGSNVATQKPATVAEVVAKAVMCKNGVDTDTSRTQPQTCTQSKADSTLQPAPLPAKKP